MEKTRKWLLTCTQQLTPLHASVLGGNKDCVIKLVEAGHPLNPLDAEHQTPLLAAAYKSLRARGKGTSAGIQRR